MFIAIGVIGVAPPFWNHHSSTLEGIEVWPEDWLSEELGVGSLLDLPFLKIRCGHVGTGVVDLHPKVVKPRPDVFIGALSSISSKGKELLMVGKFFLSTLD